MTWNLYEKLISDIAEFPGPIKTLSLHKDGEPLLNTRLGEMVALAKKRGVSKRIIILTNAALLTRDRSIELIEAGLDVIRISVEHVSEEGYRRYTQNFGDYNLIVQNVRMLREECERRNASLFISAKLIDLGFSEEELAVFSRDFGPICHEIGRTTAQGWSHSDLFDFTLGMNPTVALDGHTPLQASRIVCPFPFYTMAVAADGLVSPCPDDWTGKAAVGDAKREKLIEIWKGSRLHEFRRMHLEGLRSQNDACGHCCCIQGIPEDSDLDSDREGLRALFGRVP